MPKQHKIYAVHGVGQVASYSFGSRDVVPDTGIATGQAAPSKTDFFNYGSMTEGEFQMMLMLSMVRLKQRGYEDPSGIYAQAERNITSRLVAGVHTAGQRTFIGNQAPELNALNQRIIQATALGNPAGFLREDSGRRSINMGFDPNNPPVQLSDCNAVFNSTLANLTTGTGLLDAEGNPVFGGGANNSAQIEQAIAAATEARNFCNLQNLDIASLNQLMCRPKVFARKRLSPGFTTPYWIRKMPYEWIYFRKEDHAR